MITIRSIVPPLCIALAACAGPGVSQREPFFEVTDFEFGKMRQHGGLWEIYQSGTDIDYEVNGACEFDGEAYPCMWYGSVIEYRTNHDKLVLDCEARVSDQVDFGSAEGTTAEQSQRFNFTLTFDGGRTEKRTPNYIIASNEVTPPDYSKFRCFYDGEEVLSYSLTVTYGVPRAQAQPRMALLTTDG
jgi:hypothetical protein